jgi:MFS family permease
MFAFSSLAALINYSATYAISFLMSLYLQKIRGMTPQGAGLVLVSMPVMMAAFSPAAGRISDRIAPRLIATFGMILTCIGLLLFIFVGEDASLGRIIGYLALLGLGFAFFSSPNTNAIMSSVEKRFLGIASGTTGTMRSLGMMLSMGVSTVIFAIIIGRVQITPERYPELMRSISIAFMVFTLFCFAGVFASLVRGRQAAGQGEEAPAEDCMLEKRSR